MTAGIGFNLGCGRQASHPRKITENGLSEKNQNIGGIPSRPES